MNILEEYKELYYKELELNDRLNNKMGTHITFITIIATAEILLWKDVFLLLDVSWIWLYIILTIVSSMCFAITIYYFYKSYIGYRYEYIHLPETKKYIDTAKEYSAKNDVSQENMNIYIEKMFENRFSNIGITNRENNIRKNRFQYFFTKWLCMSFLSLLLAYGFWIVVVNPYKAEIESQSIQQVYLKGGITPMVDEEKTIPDDLQPEPTSQSFYESFNRSPEIRHSDIASEDNSSNDNNSKE